jgi:hypothetical protein
MENPQGKRFVGYQDTDNPYFRGGSQEQSLENIRSARRRTSPTHSGHSQPRTNPEYTTQNPGNPQQSNQKIIRRYYVSDPSKQDSKSVSATSSKVMHHSSSHYVYESKSRDNMHYNSKGPSRVRSYKYVNTDLLTLPPTTKPQTTKRIISAHQNFAPDPTSQSMNSIQSTPKSYTYRRGVNQSNNDIIYRPADRSIRGNEYEFND